MFIFASLFLTAYFCMFIFAGLFLHVYFCMFIFCRFSSCPWTIFACLVHVHKKRDYHNTMRQSLQNRVMERW